jgi:hypothetical protein
MIARMLRCGRFNMLSGGRDKALRRAADWSIQRPSSVLPSWQAPPAGVMSSKVRQLR